MAAITTNDLNNAKLDVDHIAAIATSTNLTATDRLGNTKNTVAGAVYSMQAFNNRGAWTALTAYVVKDLVSVSGTWYVAVIAHTSSAAFDTDTASKWRVYQGVIAGDLSAATGASMVGFIQNGDGAISRNLLNKERETVSVDDFGSDTAAWNAAILFLALRGGGKLTAPSSAYTILGKVLVPANIEIDLCKTTITGSLSSTLFESGYLTGGAIITNIGTANESHSLYGTRIHNGTIKSSLLGFNAFNFLAGCALYDIEFYDCVKNVYAKRSFYNSWSNLYSANTVLNLRTGIAAYTFDDNVNAVHFDRVFTTGRALSYLFKGPIFQGKISGLSAEGGTDGIVIENETFALEISGNYFESLTGKAVDMSYSAQHHDTVIDHNFFHICDTGIYCQLMFGGKIGSGNTFTGVTNLVAVTDDLYSTITVSIPQQSADSVTGYALALPAGYVLGKKVSIEGIAEIYSNATGLPLINATMPNGKSGMIPLMYGGDSGMVSGKIPFCTHVSDNPGGTPFNVLIDTPIFYSPYSMGIFRVQINDGVGTYVLSGRIYGLTVFLDEAAGKTASAAYSAGYVQLQLNGFSGAGGAYGAEGIVRIV